MRPSQRFASLVFATSIACTVYQVPEDDTDSGGSTAPGTTAAGSTSVGATGTTTMSGPDPTTTWATSSATEPDPSAGPTTNPTGVTSDTTTDDPPVQCDFATSIQSIFSANCGCHDGAMPPKGLILAAGSAYDNLVDVDSMEQPGTPRVAPGNPAGSWLVTKLKPNPPMPGVQMPLGGMLMPEQVALIETWIAAGASETEPFDCGDGGNGDAGSVTIDEAGPVNVEIGETLDLDVTVLDDQGQPVMMPMVKWISSDETTLYVDGKGTLLGLNPGSAEVTAEVAGVVSDALTVEVLNNANVAAVPFADVLNTLNTNCGCHKGDMPAAGMKVDADAPTVHATLLAPATQDAMSNRIVPDAPGQSYLFKKLTRTVQTTGEQMPKGKAPLDAEKVQIIFRWIFNGALP